MERVTISMPDEFAAELSAFMDSGGYANRSEALRDLARLGLQHARLNAERGGECFATLSYVYNHHTRELPKRLTGAHHDHHHLHVATLHVHLDHESCLEVAVLRGKAEAVRDFANGVIAERGVTHGQVSFIPVTLENQTHQHGDDANAGKHLHAHPKE
jgi:CopG family nickel-responsive transcriptional regulator